MGQEKLLQLQCYSFLRFFWLWLFFLRKINTTHCLAHTPSLGACGHPPPPLSLMFATRLSPGRHNRPMAPLRSIFFLAVADGQPELLEKLKRQKRIKMNHEHVPFQICSRQPG